MVDSINNIDQTYLIAHSFLPGIFEGEIYHWNALLAAANKNNLQTLSSHRSFYIYNQEGDAKLVIALNPEIIKERLLCPLI